MSVLGFGFGFLIVPLIVLGLLVLVVAAVLSDRREPDPGARRPYTLYLVAMTFVTLFITLFAASAVVSSIVRLAVPNSDGLPAAFAEGSGKAYVEAPSEAPLVAQPGPTEIFEGGFGGFSPRSEHVRSLVQAGLVVLAAGLILLYHGRRLRDLVAETGFAEGPSRRAYQGYLYAACFVGVLIVLGAGVAAALGLSRIIAPGTMGFGPAGSVRKDGIVDLVSMGILAAGAYAIFWFHWGRAEAFRRPPPEGDTAQVEPAGPMPPA
jgi:hypothetical protein